MRLCNSVLGTLLRRRCRVPYPQKGAKNHPSRRVRYPSLLHHGRNIPPFPREYKRIERLARPRRVFLFSQLFRQYSRIARVANRKAGYGLIPFGNSEKLARFFGENSRHLVDLQSERRRLQSKIRSGLAHIMKRMIVRCAVVLEFHPRHAQSNYRCTLGPTLVKLHEAFQDFLVVFWIVLRGHDEIPRLRVERRRRPPRGLEQASQLLQLDRPTLECSRAPAIPNQIVDWRRRLRRLL